MGKRGIRLLGMLLAGCMALSALSVPVYAKTSIKTDTEALQAEVNKATAKQTLKGVSGKQDNEELYDGYVASLFGIEPEEGLSAGDKALGKRLYGASIDKTTLNEDERWLYNQLAAEIKKVAAGERTDTQFEIKIPENEERFVWTPAECGVNGLSNDYSTKLVDKIKASVKKVCDCLYFEMPYDLYWHNWNDYSRTGCTGGGDITYLSEKNALKIGTIQVSFVVAEKYAAPAQTGYYYLYQTNLGASDNLRRAKNAAENAKSIVAANRNKSDYDKLYSYMTEICKLNTYDHHAAAVGHLTAGIDPWQLVYVFDKDPNTNVVCEGYAKAYAYLCDESTFKDPNIACYFVGGYVTSGSIIKGWHAWDVVTMDDGQNYMVDVTWCDDDDGNSYDDYLFLASFPGTAGGSYIAPWGAYEYDPYTTNVYGTGDDSILTLKKTNDYMHYRPERPDSKPIVPENPESKPIEERPEQTMDPTLDPIDDSTFDWDSWLAEIMSQYDSDTEKPDSDDSDIDDSNLEEPAYMDDLNVKWDLKPNKTVKVKDTWAGVGKKNSTIKITNFKITDADEEGYKQLSFTYTDSINWKPTKKQVHKICTYNSEYANGGCYYGIIDRNTGYWADCVEDVTIKESKCKSKTKVYKDSDGCKLTMKKTNMVKVTVTFPEDYDGLCIVVGGSNKLKDTAKDKEFWNGECPFGKTSYYKNGKSNSHWMLVQ